MRGHRSQIGQIRQCSLAGSYKKAPRILIFSIAMVADYSFYVKTIETHARAILTLNSLAIGRVQGNHQNCDKKVLKAPDTIFFLSQ